MRCPNCKGEIKEGQSFCNHCGMPIPENVLEDSEKKGKRKKIKIREVDRKNQGKTIKRQFCFRLE